MANDPDEETTQHYCVLRGFGPVSGTEELAFAVFEGTPVDGDRLQSNSFTNERLKKRNESVLRLRYVTNREFRRKIVGNRNLLGVATANAGVLRSMTVEINRKGQKLTVPSICVIDRAVRGDPDGHASIGFAASSQQDLSETEKKRVRSRIRLEMADRFSSITQPRNVAWPTRFQTLVGRCQWMARVIGFRRRVATA